MAKPPILYQEVRLSPKPLFPSSILRINTASSSSSSIPNPLSSSSSSSSASSTSIFTTSRKRAFDELNTRASPPDEASFARAHLASDASLFFRSAGRAPHTYLWRTLHDRHLLELQCLDLVLDRKLSHSEGWLTYHIYFASPIAPHGVVLADAEDADALEIFVLTAANELFTVSLKREVLVLGAVPKEFDASAWVKRFVPAALGFRRPYRVFAAEGAKEVYISLQDGGLMRLERGKGESGAQWRETFFSEGGWSGTLKGLIPFGRAQTVKYGSVELDANAIAAVAKSPDGNYLWTVGLDHTLKAWNVKSGKIAMAVDLLHESVDREERKRHVQYVMGAEQGTLLQVVVPPPPYLSTTTNQRGQAMEDGKYFLVVHSPKDHQFKFYAISSSVSLTLEDAITLIDLKPAARLVPPIDDLMNTNIWHLEQFFVSPGPMWLQSELWIRARSGALCHTFTITFDLMDEAGNLSDLDDLWRNGWSVVDSSSLSGERLKELPEFSGLDIAASTTSTPSEKWTEFLFFPGRFSEATLETALHTYRKAVGLAKSSDGRSNTIDKSLKERLVTSIAAKGVLRRRPSEQPDHEHYRLTLQKEWQTFFTILLDLHKRRHESLSLAMDVTGGLMWSACTDFVAPIRMSSDLERLRLNADLIVSNGLDNIDETLANRVISADEEDMTRGQVIAVAQQFRRFFSEAAKAKLNEIATLSALDPPEGQSAADVLQIMYDACDLHNEVSDDEFSAVNEAAEHFGGLGSLSVDAFLMVMEKLEDSTEKRGRDSQMDLCRYGAVATVAIAQETLQQTYSLLLDILALVVFMTGDLEPAELHPDFRPDETFDAIIMHLRHLLLRLWMMGHVHQVAQHSSSGEEKSREYQTLPIYEDIFIGEWDPRIGQYSQLPSELLTFWSKQWLCKIDLAQHWEAVTAQTMAYLLRHQDYDLAEDFVKFITRGAWSYYLKARLHIATGDYALASLEFKQAADEMSHLPNPTSFRSSNLLSAQDLAHFGKGVARYFEHVLLLFERIKAYSYTADFASLALTQLEPNTDLNLSIAELDRRKSEFNSPAAQQIDNTMEEIRILKLKESRDTILTHLFNALTQTGHFDQAYDTLLNIANPKLQTASLHTLLETCIRQDAVPTLLRLPITGELAHEADHALTRLAKKSLASGPASGPPYHRILFSFRAKRSDFRGAAAILYEHLERLRHSKRLALLDPEDDTLVRVYVLLINTLACCCGERRSDQQTAITNATTTTTKNVAGVVGGLDGDVAGGAWLLADPIPGVHGLGVKRKLVTLDQIRAEYAAELDRRSDVMLGRFPIVGGSGDEMDVL